MIQLDQNKLRNMYPEMTEEFSDRMHHMVHALPLQKEEKQVKRISFCIRLFLHGHEHDRNRCGRRRRLCNDFAEHPCRHQES